MLKFKVAAHGTAHIVGRAGKRKTSEKRCGKQVTRVHPRIISPWGPTCRPSQHTWVIQVEGSIPAPPPEGRQLVLLRKKNMEMEPTFWRFPSKNSIKYSQTSFQFFCFFGFKTFHSFPEASPRENSVKTWSNWMKSGIGGPQSVVMTFTRAATYWSVSDQMALHHLIYSALSHWHTAGRFSRNSNFIQMLIPCVCVCSLIFIQFKWIKLFEISLEM